MNKIKVVDDNLQLANVSKNIEIEYYKKECLFAINDIKINVKKSSDLDINIKLQNESKINFVINVLDDVTLNLNIVCQGNKGKIQYKYDLSNDSSCNIYKYQSVSSIKEMISVKLDGINSKINYNFKTISEEKETYDYHIFHNNINTVCNIKNNGVCIKNGEIIYQVSNFVPKNITGCVINQNNRIINLTENKCEIKPNLYIDCNDTIASHSALIGKFSDEEMFYIQSRGIDYNNTLKLLINGFLTSDIDNKVMLKNINKDIDKYWR